MLSKDMQAIQELLAHPGWDIFKTLVLGPDSQERILLNKKCLKTQLNDKLMASARNGEQNNSAKFAGQIDILPVIFAIPQQELEKSIQTKAPITTEQDRS